MISLAHSPVLPVLTWGAIIGAAVAGWLFSLPIAAGSLVAGCIAYTIMRWDHLGMWAGRLGFWFVPVAVVMVPVTQALTLAFPFGLVDGARQLLAAIA